MAIAVPISIGIAIFITEMMKNKLGTILSFIVELLAAVPSIIYGLWGLFVFRFWIRDYIEEPLHNTFGETVTGTQRETSGSSGNQSREFAQAGERL
jgi:phosphate transport system permease protein